MTRTGLHISKLLKVVVDDDDDDDDDGEVTMMTTATMMMMMMMIGNVKKRNYRYFFFCRNFSQALFCSRKEIFSLEQYVEGFQKFHTKKKDVLPVSLRTSSPAGTLRYSLIKSQPISIHPLLGLRYSNF